MDAHGALKLTIGSGGYVAMAYIEDLTDCDLMRRAAPKINHINWQIGHLLLSDFNHINDILPGSMPALPEGFAERYSRDTAASDDPARFLNKESLQKIYHEQRAAILKALDSVSADDLDRPSPEKYQQYAPTWASLFDLAGVHWLMHCGQWAVVRRQIGKPALF